MKRKKRKKKIFSLHVFVNIQYYETLTRFNTRTIYIEYGYNSKKYSLLYFVVILISGMHLVGGGGGWITGYESNKLSPPPPPGPDSCPFSLQLKLCHQILRPISKKRFEKSV